MIAPRVALVYNCLHACLYGTKINHISYIDVAWIEGKRIIIVVSIIGFCYIARCIRALHSRGMQIVQEQRVILPSKYSKLYTYICIHNVIWMTTIIIIYHRDKTRDTVHVIQI